MGILVIVDFIKSFALWHIVMFCVNMFSHLQWGSMPITADSVWVWVIWALIIATTYGFHTERKEKRAK